MVPATASGYRIAAATGIDRGDRDYQQDQVCLLNHPRANGCLLGVVADGMGGRSGGRKASDQVMLTARQLFERYDPHTDDADELLRRIAHDAHLVIQLTAVAAEEEPHSTFAGFVLNPNGDCHWLHSGDSRLYHFEQGRFRRHTKDHSYVQALVDQGQLTEAQAQNHPRANVLLGCLGMADREPPLTPGAIPAMRAGDALLVCSDGLWHYFRNEELAQVVFTLPPREACELLVSKARQRAQGAGDNLSLIVVKLEPLAPVAATKINPFTGSPRA